MEYEKLSREDLIKELKNRDTKIAQLEPHMGKHIVNEGLSSTSGHSVDTNKNSHGLDLYSIKRYSRQLILPEIGPKGQKKLLESSVLIVGCGGLGCPAAVYLAAAGVGILGFVDYDDVEVSNLHRQVLHTESRIGSPKVNSVIAAVQNLNSHVHCIPHLVSLSSKNIMNIVGNYDIVLDCTDNVPTRYLLNDACIFSCKPLVSGSALRFEGQLTVYGYNNGPCYRCLFPQPPPPETVTNCSDGGVLGVVPGILGCLQALETIKIIVGCGDICSQKLILFDALSLSFRNIKLRNRQANCQLCGSSPIIKSLIDYEQFCGSAATDKDSGLNILENADRVSVSELQRIRENKIPHILIDVRNPIELEICNLSDTLNIPLQKISAKESNDEIRLKLQESGSKKLICICKRGNDSQKAVVSLKQNISDVSIADVVGGLTAWANHIDENFPIY